MGYVISGTTVSSVDYTDFPFGGASGTGDSLSSASTWISYTFTRPTVRAGQDGLQYFIVKNVSFRMCSAPSTSQKTYGRVSWADGSQYANSYQPPNTISWQKSPTVTYTFQGTKFAVKEGSNGTTLRVWLVSAGAFLFQRNSTGAGHVVAANGHTYSGSPAGYLTVAQLASPPKSLTAVRTTANVQAITITWSKPDHLGGTASGYHLEVAEDSAFTVGVRQYYPAIKSGAALTYTTTGYSQNKAYYFRIAARNEVSDHFTLKGGQWSNVVTVPIDTSTPTTLSTSTGVTGGTATSGDPGGTTGSTGSTSTTTTSSGSTTGGTTGSTTGGTTTSTGGTTGTSGSTGASSTGPSGAIATTTDPAVAIVFTPIPDTSSTRSAFGTRLLSRPTGSSETTVFLYDRGGHRRLGQLNGWTDVRWSRVKDDKSSATVTMTPEVAKENAAILERMGVARSELVIFRGDQRVWEGPVTRAAYNRGGISIDAEDILWYASRTIMHGGYSNAYPNVGNVVERIAGIITAEMARLETPVRDPATGAILVPSINMLSHLHTYVADGDARTSVVTDPYSATVWSHLDELASRSGIDYVVIGRAVHIWDTSRPALGVTRTVTDEDFLGSPEITQYGSALATVSTVTDGQGDFATAYDNGELTKPYYGQIESLATAYGVNSTTTTTDPSTGTVVKTITASTLTGSDMIDQAVSALVGRSPAPWLLHVPANASVDMSRPGLGMDVLIPGVFVPIVATLSGRTFKQMQKITRVDVTVTGNRSGRQEAVSVSMEPATNFDASTLAV